MSDADDMREKLSALVDSELDELNERRVMAALGQDAGLRSTWRRYHLTRAALRGELDEFAGLDVAERVTVRIAAEPADAGVMRRRNTARLVGTLAMAASVAVIAIAAVQWFNRPDSSPAPLLATAQTAPEKIVRVDATRREAQSRDTETDNALNAFLVEHNEFASSNGLGGMMPYVRVVGYENPAK